MERTDGERCSRSVLGARNCELHLRDSLFLFLSLFPRITHVKITLERAVRDARRNVGTPAHPSFRQPVIPRRRDRDRRRKRNCKGRRRLPERGERIARVPTRLYRATRLQRVIIYTAREARARARATGIGRAPLLPLCARAFKTRRPFHLSTNLTEATGAERSER